MIRILQPLVVSIECIVVINPLTIPNSWSSTLATGQAVGGAGGVRYDMVLISLVFVLIYTQHDSDILVFGRGGNNNLFDAALFMRSRFFGIGKYAGGFDNYINTIFRPGNLGGIFVKVLLYFTIDRYNVIVDADISLICSICTVPFKEVSICFGIRQVVDSYHFQAIAVIFVL